MRPLSCILDGDELLQVISSLPDSIVSVLHIFCPSLFRPLLMKPDEVGDEMHPGDDHFLPVAPAYQKRSVVHVKPCCLELINTVTPKRECALSTAGKQSSKAD